MNFLKQFGLPLCLFLFSLHLVSCGGFGSVENLGIIEIPSDIPPGLEEQLSVSTSPETDLSKSKDEKILKKTKGGKYVEGIPKTPSLAFELSEAKKRLDMVGDTKAFRAGEKTTLALTWFAIKAGEVTLEVQPAVWIGDRKSYHFVGTAKSSSMMDLIHSIDDYIESFVDVKTFYPFKSTIRAMETDRLRRGHVLFDYPNQKIHYWMKRVHVKKGVKEKKRIDNFSPGVLDVFSSAFFLRAQKLEVGKTYTSDVYNEGKFITVKAEVLRREVLVTDIGDFNTLVIRPEARFQGILTTSGESKVWVTDDERHFILQLETKIKLGSLKGHIVKIEDPDYTFPSRINQEK